MVDEPIWGADLDYVALTKMLDQSKGKVFLDPDGAFLGGLMCSMDYIWSPSVETACTNCVDYVAWNPYWFQKLSKETRLTVLVHEINHPACLHKVRQGDRDPELWNFATDISINNRLFKKGYSFKEIGWSWRDPRYGVDVLEEEIYDDIVKLGTLPPGGSFSQGPTIPGGPPPTGLGNCPIPAVTQNGDMTPITKEQIMQSVRQVLSAAAAASAAGSAGTMAGDMQQICKQFLAPVIPWEKELLAFFIELAPGGRSWVRPKRRMLHSVYLPSRIVNRSGLTKMFMYLDVSGSISDHNILRFNSEAKYIKDRFNPDEFWLIQFDTKIQKIDVIKKDDPFTQINVTGRGGTDLSCVHEHIERERPSAVIIFTDLECDPMEHISYNPPVLWAVVNHTTKPIPFGKYIYMRR